MPNAVIAGYARSPFTPAGKGALARVRPDDLLAQVIRGLLARTGAKPEDIEDVVVGCAFPEGEQGFNIGRMAVFLADLPITAAGSTVNRWCGSSMTGVHMAVGAIAAGAGELFVCAGVESMSRVPMMGFNPMVNPFLAKERPDTLLSMGVTAENLAQRYQIGRADQEAFAVESHRRAAEAEAQGRFADEIVPIQTKDGVVDRDGCIRPDTSAEGLAALKPVFMTTGSVTAGTSSPLTDGAAAVLVAEEGYAQRHNLPILARIRSIATAGCAPDVMGIGPVPASRKALARAGLDVGAMDYVELNEAFAAQAMAVHKDLMLDHARTNVDGGAIALGHPLGASGARVTGKAAQVLAREGAKHALATMCIGGGQGVATVLESAR